MVIADRNEVHRLEQELENFARPVGVTGAIWILSIFSVLGILLPLVFLGFIDGPVPTWTTILFLVSFAIGLMSALGYIAWYKWVIGMAREGSVG